MFANKNLILALVDLENPGSAHAMISLETDAEESDKYAVSLSRDYNTSRTLCEKGPAFESYVATSKNFPVVESSTFDDYKDSELAFVCQPTKQSESTETSYRIRALGSSYARSSLQVRISNSSSRVSYNLNHFQEKESKIRYSVAEGSFQYPPVPEGTFFSFNK